MIRLLLVEDHIALRTSLAFLLQQSYGMTVTAEAGTIAEALGCLNNTDVALIDLDLPDGVGTTLIPRLRASNPEAATLILTGSKDRLQYAQAIEQGATGIIYKADSIDRVVEAVHRARSGQPIHTQSEVIDFMNLLARHRSHHAEASRLRASITPREYDLLRALAHGLGDQEIAEQLHLSIRTVQSHMLNLMDKLDVHSRLQALVVAVRHGLIEIAPD